MTRINVVPVQELMDQHLMAEWREIKHLPPLRLKCRVADDALPPTYRMSKGHVLFFMNKGAFLHRRHAHLWCELRDRGFSVENHSWDWQGAFMGAAHWQDYEPTPEALIINRARIAERIAARPGWYRFRGGPVTP